MEDTRLSLKSQNDFESRAHIITFGNEKGGSGKSTCAMHTAIALLRLGYKVGSIDLDARQGTFTRYLKHRWQYNMANHKSVPSPLHMAIERSQAETITEQQEEEYSFLNMAVQELGMDYDFIVIDTPGTDCYLSRLAHFCADTLVTPMNDSLIDLDLIARVDLSNDQITEPSIYTRMVLNQQKERHDHYKRPMRWIVCRNRMAHLHSQNQERITEVLSKAGKEFGFTPVTGLSERVIYKELFLRGLTLLDLKEDSNQSLTMSQIAARQEVRHLITAIAPEEHKGYREHMKA